jgi:cytochrome c553
MQGTGFRARRGLVLCLLLACASACAARADDFTVPGWLFPIQPAAPAGAAVAADTSPLRVPGSKAAYTRAQVTDLFGAPDWFPDAHPPMPEVVAHGRKPGVYACGYCHLPDGSGRPENATLAGLPPAYIVDQMTAFATGARRTAWTGPVFLPADVMARTASVVTVAEIADAAAYFSSLPLRHARAEIVETERIPATRMGSWIHVQTGDGGQELLGNRVIEVPRSLGRHELRDPHTPYVAYVPNGSLARGRTLALEGAGGAPACASCHGAGLRGDVLAPPIAGRSPTYLLRQLVAFRTRARSTPAGAPMQAVVDALTLEDMIAAAAYAAAQPP